MSTPNREQIIEFYTDTNYLSIRDSIYRPSELHIPNFLKRQDNVISEACKNTSGDNVKCNGPKKLDKKRCQLRGIPPLVEINASHFRTRPVSNIPMMNEFVWSCKHLR